MKLSLLLVAFCVAAFSSCTTAYKTGQTPDDVYYSPGKPQDEYVVVEKRDDRYYSGSDEDYYEDRFLRMRLQNRYRWSALDDYYFYNTYAYNPYGYYHSWNNPWNSYYTWNNFYNPYYGGIPYYPGIIIIKNPVRYNPPSRPLAFNPASYNTGTGSNLNRPAGSRGLSNSYNNNNSNRYNNSNSNRSSLGQSVRKVFSNSNNNNDSYTPSSNSTPSRSYTPSSNSSSSSSSRSSSSSSSSSGGGSSRPPR